MYCSQAVLVGLKSNKNVLEVFFSMVIGEKCFLIAVKFFIQMRVEQKLHSVLS